MNVSRYLPHIGFIVVETFRVLISAMLSGVVTFGTAVTTVAANGQEPTHWQVRLALIGGIIAAANDIKSRITPVTKKEERKV